MRRFWTGVRRRWQATTRIRQYVGTVLAFAIVGGAALYLLGRPWVHGWDRFSDGELQWDKRLTIAIGVGSVVGAAFLLVNTTRRQRFAEESHRLAISGQAMQQIREAAKQLGDTSTPARIGAVYALTHLADEHPYGSAWSYETRQRQACIDVLCGYLRLQSSRRAEAEVTHAVTAAGPSLSRTYGTSEDHSEVERTVLEVIAQHLDGTADVSWRAHSFNLRGVHFDSVAFVDAVFSDVDFTGAYFDNTNFDRVKFLDHVSFRDARFGNVSFVGTHFAGVTSFDATLFRAPILFLAARFDGVTRFTGIKFEIDGELDFALATVGRKAKLTFDHTEEHFGPNIKLNGIVMRDDSSIEGLPSTTTKPAQPSGPQRRNFLSRNRTQPPANTP